MSNPNLNLWKAKIRGSYVSWTWNSILERLSNFAIDNDGIDNAWAARGCYNDLGWSDAAISAVVGMQCWECGLNPWRWQGDNVLAYTDHQGRYVDTTHGYGLPQFTPQAVYSDPSGYGASSVLVNFYNTDPDFIANFAPNYSDVAGRASDGEAQCRYIDAECSLSGAGVYFRRRKNNAPMYYEYGYMDFPTFKTIALGQSYTSQDSTANCHYKTYTVTLDILIYQWLNNYGRGAAETSQSTAVRSTAASYLYNLYTGTPPPHPIPPFGRRKMPFWMLAMRRPRFI